ncbi:MAG: chemotaxis protein CheW [Acidobacteriota bacterium]
MEFAEEIREFLIESNENLQTLDQQMVELEQNPSDEHLIASVFRAIHTIKGTSGFFGFQTLGSITHIAESILGQVRDRARPLTPDLVSLILETVDAVRQILERIESCNEEGENSYQELRERLTAAYKEPAGEPAGEPAAATAPEPARIQGQALEASPMSERQAVSGAGKIPLPEAASSSPNGRRPERDTDPGQDRCEQSSGQQVSPSPTEELQSDSLLHRPGQDWAGIGAAPVPNDGHQHASQERRELLGGRRATDATEGSTIRVDVKLLDKLMNLVGELVLARNQILQGSQQPNATSTTAQRLNLITSELQEGVMLTRMQPIGVVWNIFPRVVRDLAAEMGKDIRIQMEGTATELDKTIIEAIKDPLTHMVRNCCDHGIESPEVRVAKGKSPQGTILLRAYHEGGQVNIEVQDDGAGIDPGKIKSKAVQKGLITDSQAAMMQESEALRLIFLPGFSTAERVSNISGRGVGMDVVKTNIEKISGTVDIAQRSNAGTTFKIKIPLTLAIIPGLIVSIQDHQSRATAAPALRFVIPQANLVELVRLEGAAGRQQIERVHGAEVYRRRGRLLPLISLRQVLGVARSGQALQTHGSVESPDDQGSVINIVVVQAEETTFGLVVDHVNDTQEIVVKALGRQLKSLGCYLGATIMGDGKIALILDVTGLAHLAHVVTNEQQIQAVDGELAAKTLDRAQMLLLFRCKGFARLVLPLSLVARLEEIPVARTESAGGARVLAYRDTIMPLVRLDCLLDAGAADPSRPEDNLQVIVFQDGGRYIGLIVEEILDIISDNVTIKSPGTAFGLLGSGVVNGKVTDFVDLDALLRRAAGTRTDPVPTVSRSPHRILLAYPRRIVRGNLRSYLEIRGHQVIEAATWAEAAKALEQETMEVIFTALDLGDRSGADLLAHVRRLRSLESVKVAVLLGEDQTPGSATADSPGFDQYLQFSDRGAILSYLETLPTGRTAHAPANLAREHKEWAA